MILVASSLNTQHERIRAKTDQIGMRIVCLSGAISLPRWTFASVSYHYLKKSKLVGLVQSVHHRCHDNAKTIAQLPLNNNQSLNLKYSRSCTQNLWLQTMEGHAKMIFLPYKIGRHKTIDVI